MMKTTNFTTLKPTTDSIKLWHNLNKNGKRERLKMVECLLVECNSYAKQELMLFTSGIGKKVDAEKLRLDIIKDNYSSREYKREIAELLG